MWRSLGRFSRAAFEQDVAGGLAAELAGVLTISLAIARDPADEVTAVVAELRALGHDLWHWDGSDDFDIWGRDYVRPQAKRIIVHWFFPADGDRRVEVTFGPWPKKAAPANE